MMVDGFFRFKKRHIRYDGITLLTADFDTRVKRHRSVVQSGKIDKIEEKRFFHHNRQFFDDWEKEMRTLIEQDISNQLPIYTTNTSVDVVAQQVFERILGIQNAKETAHIVMLKPDALSSIADKSSVYSLYLAFVNHLLQMNRFTITEEMEMVSREAH